MMTTETRRSDGATGLGVASLGTGVLGGVLLVTALVGLATVALAALLSGLDGAVGALVGAGIVVAVFAFGCFSLALVARVLPSATLLVALVTYLAQAVVMVLVFVRLSEAARFEDGPGRVWLALGLVAATLAWMTAQLVLTVRQRVPYYDLPGGQ
jgi:ATP synthase protein I